VRKTTAVAAATSKPIPAGTSSSTSTGAWRLGAVALASTLAGAMAYALFRALPPMRVRVGLHEIDETVSPAYHAIAFPPLASLLLESGRVSQTRRVLIALGTGTLALVRLGGGLPLSGHAVFLGAALACSVRGRMPITILLSGGALAATMVHKIAWGDVKWGLLSAAFGVLVGFLAAGGKRVRAARVPRARRNRS
jgi:hypothetical protein